MFSAGEIILIAIVALFLFGPTKLPELGRTLGRTLSEFKKGAQGLMEDAHAAAPQDVRQDAMQRPVPDPVSELITAPVQTDHAVPAQLQQTPSSRDKREDLRRLPE
ncbi:twin-arginine translocase TatA/TatE family subunit [Paenibacillus xerothermodurans]|uniref:Sec-independent protein translocase protein TatA n=1 Tax=Paenibacillus xerothermodurans TaxID=1977292 RepID=A0A2W1NSU2_PAEXE|nr:twin-arginine translocase TatA/TatE family subunit [Paenibacillus xerothermodurans]